MASAPYLTPPASFDTAFRRLRDQVSPEDARLFSVTLTMEDVWETAREIEHQLQQKRTLRGFVRIPPFLTGIEQYFGVVEVLCQGTPYLPFIWAPIKLLLQIAQGHMSALESLIDAYAMIGDAMPRFDKFSRAFVEDSDFQQILGLFYADILEFHRRAYKFFRRRCRSLFAPIASLVSFPPTEAVAAWAIMFESLWRTFRSRFESIIESLRRHQDLIDREAAAFDITQAKEWRAQQMRDVRQWRTERAEYLDKLEKDLLATQVREAVAWFGARDEQDNEFSRVSDAWASKHWALEDPNVLLWLDQSRYNSILWLNGKPGAGKSVICSKIIEHLQSSDNTTIIYYFCRHDHQTQYPATDIFKEFATQLLAANRELAPYILDKFANNGLKPAKRHLTVIVERLIAALPSVRVIVDGLDELPKNVQGEVIKDLLKLKGISVGAYKLLLSSQCISSITQTLGNKPQLRLEDCSESVDAAIAAFVTPKMDELRQRFDQSIVDLLESKILQKAQGMLLWVRLILWMLEDLNFKWQLQDAIEALPESLTALYEKILVRICGNGTQPGQHMALRIFQWLLVARRPLRRAELEAGISLDCNRTRITADTKVHGDVLSLCDPFIHCEAGLSGKVRLFHFTAEKFLSTCPAYADLQAQSAHHAVSLSCSLYLHSALEMIDPQIPKLAIREEVLSGFHDLHIYANDYLLEHLRSLTSSKAMIPQGDTHAALRMSLERLAARHFDLSRPEHGPSPSIASDDQHTAISPWDSLVISYRAQTLLSALNGFCDAAFSPAEAMVAKPDADLRDNSVTRSIANDRSMTRPALTKDPTLFSKIRQRYQNIGEDLLQQDSAIDLRLKDFQMRHNSGYFLCRFKGCHRASEGFNTFELRQQHEDRHSPQFKCNEPSCGLVGWICKTHRLWKQHTEKYHESTGEAEIPSSLDIPRILYDRRDASTPTPPTPTTLTRSTPVPPGTENQALQDFQLQLSLFEQLNKKRLLMAWHAKSKKRRDSLIKQSPTWKKEVRRLETVMLLCKTIKRS